MFLPVIKHEAKRTGAGQVYTASASIQDKFTLTSRFDEQVKLYKVLPANEICVPINCGVVSSVYDNRVTGPKVGFNSFFKSRSNEQLELVDKSTALLLSGKSHILKGHTGIGKSYIATEIAGRIGRKFLVIVPKSDIISQWVKAFKEVLGLKSSEIGLIQGDTCSVAGKKAVIAMVHSICKDGRYPSWVYSEFGLILVDEVHVISANTFSNAMWLLPAKLRLGLSATPYRQDGKDFVFYGHIGRVLVSSVDMNLVPKVIIKKCNLTMFTRKVPRDTKTGGVVWVDEKDVVQPGKTMGVNKALAKSDARNRMIAEFVFAAYKRGRRIIVFSELRDAHLANLELELIAIGVKAQDISWYVGGLKKGEREHAKTKRVLLSTYRMACVSSEQSVEDFLLGTSLKMGKLPPKLHIGFDSGKFGFNEGSGYVSGGEKCCVTLTTSLGVVTVSKDHRVMTSNGWLPASDLEVGDLIAGPKHLNIPSLDIASLAIDDLWLLGVLIGDGDFTQKGYVGFTTICSEVIARANNIMGTHGMFFDLKGGSTKDYVSKVFKRERYSKNHKSWIIALINRYGLQGCGAADKHIPLEFMYLPKEKVGALLSGLIDSDGYITTRNNIVCFDSISRRLVVQFNTLVLRLGGLVNKIREYPYKSYPGVSEDKQKPLKGWQRVMYRTQLVASSKRNFYPWLHCSVPYKSDKIKQGILQKLGGSKDDLLPAGTGIAISDALLARGVLKSEASVILKNDNMVFRWLYQRNNPPVLVAEKIISYYDLDVKLPGYRLVKLLSKIDAGVKAVGDISVSVGNNFVCGGVVVHNSMATDIPWLDTCVLATPRSDVVQIVGRILREYDGKQTPLVFDIVDMQCPLYKAYANKRLNWYLKIGSEIITL